MPKRTELTRSIPINPDIIREKINKMGLTHVQTSKLLHMTPQRLKDCLASRQSHRFSEDEIIMMSVKLDLSIPEILLVPEDIKKMEEMKRIALSEIKNMKYYTKWHKQEPPVPKDCREMKSAAEIVKKDKSKYNPLKCEPMVEKSDDPNKKYRVDCMGTKILTEEVRDGIKIVYQTP